MTKLNSVPIKTVPLKNLRSYTDIKAIFRREQIVRYLYVIKYNGDIIKFGIQYKIQEPADRIYTQIGHMPGWSQKLLERSKKTTGKSIAELIQKVDPVSFHKDNVELEIYDFSNYSFENPKSDQAVYAEMQNAEEFLKKQYFEQHGKYPPGNIKQEGFRAVCSDKKAWETCFGDTISKAEKTSLLKEKTRHHVIPAEDAFNSLFG
jgi:hypothetical protein